MEQTVKIRYVQDFPSSDPARVGKFDTIVTYQLDAFRTGLVVIPKEQFNEERVKAEIRKELEAKGQWIDKELKL
jgi:hypothetical protein